MPSRRGQGRVPLSLTSRDSLSSRSDPAPHLLPPVSRILRAKPALKDVPSRAEQRLLNNYERVKKWTKVGTNLGLVVY